jgi:hydrogenase expression/formation protein HypE
LNSGQTRLRTGKIPIAVLGSTVLRMTGTHSASVLTPPKAGLDFAAIRVGRVFMVVSTDPVTGVSENIGYYALKVSANDVATSGNRPQFAESVILLPEGSTAEDVERIAAQIHKAAKESGIAIVGGHTEVSPRLDHPIVVVTVFGFAKKFVSSGDAKEGDVIMMTKTAGLEGTAELVRERASLRRRLGPSARASASRMIGKIDITEEAVAAFRTGEVRAMHDCTEGGVIGAVFEMSLASGLGFRMLESAVPVAPVTTQVCAMLSIDPLKLIGSGSLLLAVKKGSEQRVQRALHPARATKIGEFRRGPRILVTKEGTSTVLGEAPEDELWRVLGRPSRSRHGL